jgi:FkbM family methyltransferase
MILSKAEAEDHLRRAAQSARRGRTARLVARPWKLLYPRLLRVLQRSRVTTAETFWNGRLDVILPEEVSTHIWRYGFFEEDVCVFLLRSLEPGMVFVDVGAHFGFFTLLASELVREQGRVLALEPIPKTFGQLNRNVSLNGRFENILTINAAAYSTNTTLTFYDYGLIKAGLNSAFGPRDESSLISGSQRITVDAYELDHTVRALNVPRVDVIKIDAESSEMHVLRGAEETVAEFGPRIILEVGDFDLPGVAPSTEVVQWLGQRGYVPHEWLNGQLGRHKVRDRYPYGNLLFTKNGQ